MKTATCDKVKNRLRNNRYISAGWAETYYNRIIKLMYALESKDHRLFNKFITAPSSTRFHGVYEGGLLDHSLNVCVNLLEWIHQHPKSGLKPEDCVIIGMLHDICKADLYIKQDEGKYTYDKDLVKHHAKGSIDIIKKLGIKLSHKQRTLILLHMSSWQNKEDVKALNLIDRIWLKSSLKHIKLLQAVNWADMKAAQDEMKAEGR